MGKNANLTELERNAIGAIKNDLKTLETIQFWVGLPAKQKATIQCVRLSSLLAYRCLPITIDSVNLAAFYETTVLPIVDTVLSEVNEETVINMAMCKEVIYSSWLDRTRMAQGTVSEARIWEMFYQNPANAEGIKTLVERIAAAEECRNDK